MRLIAWKAKFIGLAGPLVARLDKFRACPWSDHLDHEQILKRLGQLEQKIDALIERQTVRDWYTTDEFATQVGKVEYTVREWCRLGRIHAQKSRGGRGAHSSWRISNDELQRYRKEGLLPLEHRREYSLLN